MDDVVALKESVLHYLDRSGGLVRLIEDCELFNGSLLYYVFYIKKKKDNLL